MLTPSQLFTIMLFTPQCTQPIECAVLKFEYQAPKNSHSLPVSIHTFHFLSFPSSSISASSPFTTTLSLPAIALVSIFLFFPLFFSCSLFLLFFPLSIPVYQLLSFSLSFYLQLSGLPEAGGLLPPLLSRCHALGPPPSRRYHPGHTPLPQLLYRLVRSPWQ